MYFTELCVFSTFIGFSTCCMQNSVPEQVAMFMLKKARLAAASAVIICQGLCV